MYDRFPFSESIIHLRKDLYLAPFPVGDDLPNEVLQDLISVQRNDSAITPSTNWRNTFLVDMPKLHRENVYHTWIVGRFSSEGILQEIVGTVDIQFVDYVSRSQLPIPHVGYWTSFHHRGQSIAPVALKELMELYELTKYAALVERENTASQRVMHKCNFKEISYDETSEYYYYVCDFRL